MRIKENYTPLIVVALGLTLAIFATFQVYALREPSRIANDTKREQLVMISEGRTLYAENCAMCHGEDGEGVDAPALNDSNLLSKTADTTLFSVVGSGVPNTEMPAWGQQHGGPFTDQQVNQLVAFMRSWEPEAPDRQALAMQGDPVNGLNIFSGTCAVCHGENGSGTEIAPALNNAERLSQFDDEWYVDTINDGRPSKGMPTWGTVLSPIQVRDLVSLLRVWQRGETVELPGLDEYLSEAIHVLEHGDVEATLHELEEAAEIADGEMLATINEAIEALESGDVDAALATIEEAQELGGFEGEAGMDENMDMDSPTAQPGQQEAQAALDDLKAGQADSALAKLRVALVLADGELKEAVEHAIEDIEAEKIEEAQTTLETALSSME